MCFCNRNSFLKNTIGIAFFKVFQINVTDILQKVTSTFSTMLITSFVYRRRIQRSMMEFLWELSKKFRKIHRKICEISKNIFFHRTPLVVASEWMNINMESCAKSIAHDWKYFFVFVLLKVQHNIRIHQPCSKGVRLGRGWEFTCPMKEFTINNIFLLTLALTRT